MDVFNKYVGQAFDGRYKIEKTIGIGGMAVVFEATDLQTGKKVAVKMLKETNSQDTSAIKRFVYESKAIAMLNHPNIVKIYDISVKGENKYIVMELIKGITLKEYITQKGVLNWRETAIFVEQILSALDHAHNLGVIHRDIKPQNIMLLEGGMVKVMDFGIAKIPKGETLTMADKAIGTVYYLSPEQATSKKIDNRADIYAVGIMMYQMVTGKLPFVADSPIAVIYKQLNEIAVNPSRIVPTIPLGFEQIIMTAIEKDPDERYDTAAQMLRQLKRIQNDPTALFVKKQKTKKSNTAEIVIKKTSRTSPYDDEPAVNQTANKNKPEPTGRPMAKTKKKNTGKPKRGANTGVPLWIAVVIFVVFLALAIVGIVAIINSVMKSVSTAYIADFIKNSYDSIKSFL